MGQDIIHNLWTMSVPSTGTTSVPQIRTLALVHKIWTRNRILEIYGFRDIYLEGAGEKASIPVPFRGRMGREQARCLFHQLPSPS
jgi:hypothetical protein